MFANLLHPLRRPGQGYERAFVRQVHLRRQRTRDRGLERLLWLGWILIAVKSVLVWWACSSYATPFHPLWVILPTVAFAALCTLVYVIRR